MKQVEPEVFLISRPSIDWMAVWGYLQDVGGEEWYHRALSKVLGGEQRFVGQDLVEFAGRVCYRSWKPGLNPNVTRIREDQTEYLSNILASAHGSVLEHANYTFVLHNVSRVFTHELVRHRVGVAISQESLRYVRLDELPIWLTPHISGNERVRTAALDLAERMEAFQRLCAEEFTLDSERNFHRKKEITSEMRRWAPEGLATALTWTANVRTLRSCIEARTDPAAEVEMRLVFNKIARLMVDECPVLFGDYTVTDDEAWVTEYRKV